MAVRLIANTEQGRWADRHRDLLAVALVAVVARIAFVLITDRVWEDAMITIQHARNAVAGLGLTHHTGEGPTHGFSSALSVLIPLVGEGIAPDGGLLAIRALSIVAVLVALWFAWHLCVDLELSSSSRLLVLGFLAIEQNHLFYGMAGMETQVAVAILLGGFRHAIGGNVGRTGIATGLAVLVRPEFLVLLVPFLLLSVVLRTGVAAALRTGLIGLVVVVPWVLFTTLYYGSPVPQTILAKSSAFSTLPGGGASLEEVMHSLTTHIEPLMRSFMPFLADTMVARAPIPAVIPAIVAAFAIVCSVIGLASSRRARPWWGLTGYFLAYVAYRVIFLPTTYYDWYVPPMTAIGILFVARGLEVITPRPGRRLALATIALIAFALPFPWLTGMERAVQQVAEDGIRRPVAAYLADHVRSGESVVAEAAGYIGSSGVLLWDFPGLTSPAAYAFVQEIPRNDRSVAALVAAAEPDWAVLRPAELRMLEEGWPLAASRYDVCHRLGQGGSEIEAMGMAKRTADLQFLILRRDGC